MRKLHWSVVFIVVISLLILAGLGYVGMTSNVEVPSNIVAVLSSLISLLIGYSAGRGEEEK